MKFNEINAKEKEKEIDKCLLLLLMNKVFVNSIKEITRVIVVHLYL